MNTTIDTLQGTQNRIMNDSEFMVYITLLTWKELSLEMFSLELLAPPMCSQNKRRLVQLENMQSIFDAWMKVLNTEERYVIKRHIIDGISWRIIENELHNKSKKHAHQNRYELCKLQRTAITKMARYLEMRKVDSNFLNNS